MTIRLALVGSSGRMGSRIDALAALDPRVSVVARIDHGMPPMTPSRGSLDVVIDFSSEEGAREAMRIAFESRSALLVGTTGLSKATLGALEGLSRTNAVLVAANTSIGVAVTRRLARMAAELLGPHGWSVDVVESHHDRKKDAPSGTALAIARSLGDGGMPVDAGRIHAIRAGDTIGEHEIRLAGPSERIHIMHQAVTRDLFAAGALRAATWLAGRAAGAYSIEDSLG